MRAQRHTKSLRGFTLVEVMVVLAISAIVAAVSIPSAVSWYDSYKGTERQANAELIYTTAQNNMAQLKASGQLGDYTDNTGSDNGRVTLAANTRIGSFADSSKLTASPSANAADASMIVLNSDDANNNGDSDAKKIASALNLLVPDVTGQLSNVGFSSMSYATDAHYRVELNPKTGYVYRVFFSESAIDNKTYQDAAAAAAVLEDSQASAADKTSAQNTLNNLKVNYYGGTTAASFVEDEQEPVRGVGYFEFAQNDNGGAQVTGGYYYRINSDNSVSDEASDRLGNNNLIGDDVKDSNGALLTTDGTAYGILVLKSEVDSGKLTEPSDFSARYEVNLSDDMSTGKNGPDSRPYYFYELQSPTSPQANTASYTIEYQFTDQWNNRSTLTQSHSAGAGTTVRVTNDDLDSDSNGQVHGRMQYNGYRIDLANSSLSGKVASDGSLKLIVVLNQNPSGATSIPGDSGTSLANGVGAWYPWSATTNKDLQKISFYVNENFAAAINKGVESTLKNTYQIRTDGQLQHIGSPYGSAASKPIMDYLDDTFYQTRDISIDGKRDGTSDANWYPIGQEQTSAQIDSASKTSPQFTGAYYGGYAGQNDKATAQSGNDFKGFAAPSESDGTFTISLSDGFLLANNPAYQTSANYRSYGIFGYVSGTIRGANIQVDCNIDHELTNPHYGTLAGDAASASTTNPKKTIISDCTLRINANRTLQVTLANSYTDTLSLAAMIGSANDATIKNCTINNSGTISISPDNVNISKDCISGGLVGSATNTTIEGPKNAMGVINTGSMTMSPRGNIGQSVITGGIVGKLDNSTIKHIKLQNSSASNMEIDANTSSGDKTYLGGFVGYALNGSRIGDSTSASKGDCELTSNGGFQINFSGSRSQNGAALGGFVGYANSDADSFLSNCVLTLNGVDQTITSVGQTSGATAEGSFIGASEGNGSIVNCRANIEKDLTVGAPDNPGSWVQGIYIGGFIGNLGTVTNGQQEKTSSVTGSSLSIKSGATLNVAAVYQQGGLSAGGFLGNLSGGATLGSATAPNTLSDDGSLKVTGRSSNDAVKLGGFIGSVATERQQYSSSAVVQHCSITGSNNKKNGTLDVESDPDTRASEVYTGGFIGKADKQASISDISCTLKQLTTTAHASNGTGYSAGLIAYAQHDAGSAKTVTNADVNIANNAAVTTNAAANAFAGGFAGNLKSTSIKESDLTVGGVLTSSATCTNNGKAYAAGFISDPEDQTAIDSPSISADSMNLTAISNSDRYAGGIVADLANNAALSSPRLNVTRNIDVSAKAHDNDYGKSYVGGLIGHTSSDVATTISKTQAIIGGNATFDSSSTNEAYAGGVIGQAKSVGLNDANMTLKNNLTVNAQGNGNGESYAGGVIGETTGTDGNEKLSDVHLTLSQDTNVSASGSNTLYSGGLIGRARETAAEFMSLEQSTETSAADNRNISVAGKANEGSNPSAYVGGAIGRAESASIRNSYVAGRNAKLKLNNESNGTTYTGGFMGYATGRAKGNTYTVDASYVAADIDSSAKTVSGFSDMATLQDDAHQRKTIITNSFVLGTLSGSNENDTYAFIRAIERPDEVKGNYAALTNRDGDTPYKFADEKSSGDLSITARCFVYRKDLPTYTDEKDIAGDGAHPASYDYLTHKLGEGAKEDSPFDDFETSSVLDYIGKGGEQSKYDFVASNSAMGDTGSHYGLPGSNPFPTATKDAGGKYINYGKWIPKPKRD
jgi:prepilin-type N-terminal cleavage/methylation domain-containing protein